jgi:hypothetical protein
MAKFPTEVERSVDVATPAERAFAFLWDVVGSSGCVPGIDRCERAGGDTYGFVFQERSDGQILLVLRYRAIYCNF